MKVCRSPRHRLHMPADELYGGQLVEPFERPSMIDDILDPQHANGFQTFPNPKPVTCNRYCGGNGRSTSNSLRQFGMNG